MQEPTIDNTTEWPTLNIFNNLGVITSTQKTKATEFLWM